MTMQLKFTPDTLAILNDERYSHPVPVVQRRVEALWLKSHHLPDSQIAALWACVKTPCGIALNCTGKAV